MNGFKDVVLPVTVSLKEGKSREVLLHNVKLKCFTICEERREEEIGSKKEEEEEAMKRLEYINRF